MWLDWFYAR
jgi:hypothetical protein